MPLKAELSKNNFLYLQFFIAETLGITLLELKNRMSTEELLSWNAYFELKNEREEKAYEDAKRGAQSRRLR